MGSALVPRLASLGVVVAATRADVDLERVDDIRALVRRLRPRLVVNAAAYTAVDDAERDAERCAHLNTRAPTVLAEETARLGVPLIHYSTNYVFDGEASAPHAETAPTSPLSVYGATKAEGERGVAGGNPAHVILRTAAVYARTGRNFMRRMLELAREREELRVVDDQRVSPTPAWVVADATRAVVSDLIEERDKARGIFHVTSTGDASWYEFATEILAQDPDRASHRARRVIGIRTADYPSPTRRPLNGVLAVDLFQRTFGMELPPWEDALRRTLEDIATCP